MKNIIVVIGSIIASIVVCVAFLNTILEAIAGLAGALIWIVYFFAIGIIYEIVVRTYRFIVKRKSIK